MDYFRPKHNTRLFAWDPQHGRFVGEGSTIAANNSYKVITGKLWSESTDRGFILVSQRTGAEMLFVHVDNKYDDEGDLLVSIYREHRLYDPYNKRPLIEVHIMND